MEETSFNLNLHSSSMNKFAFQDKKGAHHYELPTENIVRWRAPFALSRYFSASFIFSNFAAPDRTPVTRALPVTALRCPNPSALAPPRPTPELALRVVVLVVPAGLLEEGALRVAVGFEVDDDDDDGPKRASRLASAFRL